jgi:hypothetical protein
MKEFPILFSTPMVQALLDGRKTMTRREVKGLPENASRDLVQIMVSGHHGEHGHVHCPYGGVGDMIWVREEHLITIESNCIVCEYKDGVVIGHHFKGLSIKTLTNIKRRKTLGKWQRGRFLPKDLARIWLQKTAIKAERLHDITTEDVLSEGVRYAVNDGRPCLELGVENSALSFLPDGILMFEEGKPVGAITEDMLLKAHWAELWCRINGRESYDANPWVWAISFKVLSTTGKPPINQ